LKQEYSEIDGVQIPRYYEYGPFVMDGWKSVAALNGKRLRLTEQEYDALYMLAKKQGEPIGFELLYKLRWEPEDGTDARDAARSGMDNIARQVGAAGKGSYKIEYTLEKGYSLISGGCL
jgi:DNA-binding response OmpR family regulator